MSGPIIAVRTGLYIDGAWRAASDGAEIEVLDPASEEVIASVASASIEDGLAAVDAAHRALPAWAATAARRDLAQGLRAHDRARGGFGEAHVSGERQGFEGCAQRSSLRRRILPLVFG